MSSAAAESSPVAGPGEEVVEVAGETLWLLPERGVFIARTHTLLIADPHWGKAAAFRASGLAVPGGTTSEGLARLDRLLERTAARRLVILGDLFHARAGKAAGTLATLREWRARWAGVQITLIRGNHDRHAGDPPAELGIACCDPPCLEPPFVLAHHPAASPAGYVLAGHLHPSVTLRGAGRQRVRLACFHFAERVGILPAFGDFTGTADIEPAAGDRIFVVAEERVMQVPL